MEQKQLTYSLTGPFREFELPVDELNYRWGELSPEEWKGRKLVALYDQIWKGLSADRIIKTGVTDLGRWVAILGMVQSIEEYGLINPLIVFEANGKYFVLTGNQRLCALRVLGRKSVYCRRAPGWGKEAQVLDVHPYIDA